MQRCNLNKYKLFIYVLFLAKIVYPQQNYNDTHPSISRDGSKLLFSSNRTGNYDIYSKDIQGNNIKQLTHNIAVDTRAEWSPDGKNIVFDSNRDGDFEIYVMNANRSNIRQLTHNSVPDMFPRWSPNGAKITFFSDRDGNREVYTMNSDGTKQKNISQNTSRDGSPFWSPNGQKLLFHSTRTGKLHFQLYTMDLNGNNQQRITHTEYPEELASWSDDGKWIVYYREDKQRKRNAEIYLMEVPNFELRQLTNYDDFEKIGEFYPPSWFPDNIHIAFWAKRKSDTGYRIFAMNILNGNLKQLI